MCRGGCWHTMMYSVQGNIYCHYSYSIVYRKKGIGGYWSCSVTVNVWLNSYIKTPRSVYACSRNSLYYRHKLVTVLIACTYSTVPFSSFAACWHCMVYRSMSHVVVSNAVKFHRRAQHWLFYYHCASAVVYFAEHKHYRYQQPWAGT
jgi:hypothetical protein